jgi:hypothetical protein
MPACVFPPHAGAFADTSGMDHCVPCPPGTANIMLGQRNCTNCTAGTAMPYPGQLRCAACAAGTFAADQGQPLCAPCDPGWFQPVQAASRCLSCPLGSFVVDPRATACEACGATISCRCVCLAAYLVMCNLRQPPVGSRFSATARPVHRVQPTRLPAPARAHAKCARARGLRRNQRGLPATGHRTSRHVLLSLCFAVQLRNVFVQLQVRPVAGSRFSMRTVSCWRRFVSRFSRTPP